MARKSTKEATNLVSNAGPRLSNKKWYNYVVHTQLFLFVAMHLVLGIYLAFVSTEYANKQVYTAKIDNHQKLDQIFAIACFLMVGVALNIHSKMKLIKKIPVRYYIYMGVAAVLPLAYVILSSMIVNGAVRENLDTLFTTGVGNTEYIVYYAGIELGTWTPADTVTWDAIGAYLTEIGEDLFQSVKLDNFDLGGVVKQMRTELYGWNMFEMFSFINLGVSAVMIVCSIFIPRQKKVKAVEAANKEDVTA